ncbi:MAG: YciI family protein [Candidatus Heimdallarchaeota archaeon]
MKTYIAWQVVKDASLIDKFLSAHLDHLETLKKDGRLLMSGPFVIPEKSGGMLIFKADSFETAKKIVESDPFIANDAEDYDLRQLELTVHKTGDFVSYH